MPDALSLPVLGGDELLRFDAFTLDLARGALLADAQEVILRPKTAQLLGVLLAHAGEVVTREALMDAVWPTVTVTDDSVTQCISEIRRALGAAGPRLLQTLPRRGYVLSAAVRRVPRVPAPPAAPVAANPGWGRAAWPLVLPVAVILGLWFTSEQPVAPPLHLQTTEASRWEAERLYAEGIALAYGPGEPEARTRAALPLFLSALEAHPGFALAAAEATFCHVNLITWGRSLDREAELREARRLSQIALTLAPQLPRARAAHAAVLRREGRFAEALEHYRYAGASPDELPSRANVGLMLILLGSPAEAEAPIRSALALAPSHRLAGTWQTYLGMAQLMAGTGDLGVAAFELQAGQSSMMDSDERRMHRAAALMRGGRHAEARLVIADVRGRRPELTQSWVRSRALSADAAYASDREEALIRPLAMLGLPE